MKKAFFIKILVFLVMCFANPTRADGQTNLLEKTVSFSWDSIRISEFLDSLSTKYQFSFSYDASVVPGDSVVYAVGDSVSIGSWLKQMLKAEELDIHQMENQVIISDEPAKIAPGAIQVQGKVIDSLDRSPMSMVNIGVMDKTIGTATNREGRFSLFLPRSYAGEKLVFSNLGYLRKQIKIPSGDTTVQVELRETSVRLPEVLVRYVEPGKIMQEVVRQKKANYASEPLILTAFFRESIRQDEQYVDVSEAVIEIYKPPYTSEFALERVRFVKGRKGEFTGDMEIIDFKLQGGPFLFSRVDIVRKGGFLPNQEGNSKYQYSFNGMDYDHGRNVFVIGFEPRNDTGELLYEGEIRVDEKTFAIVGATFEMTRRTIRKSRDYLIRRDSRRFRTRPIFAKYKIDYRPWGDKWVLNSVRGEVSMKIVDRKKNVRTEFNTVSELLISDLREGHRKEFRWSESFKANYILSEEIESYDSEFWSRYNIISPDESIEKIFKGEKSKETN